MSDADAPDDAPFEARYFRKGLGLRQAVRGEVDDEYCSELVQAFRDHGYELAFGDTTFRLAQEFGFCYGVERSVDYAYETLKRFPDRRIVLTGEIIHNPKVNGRLRELGVCFFGDDDLPDASALCPDDVVILPAFGVATGAFDAVRDSGAVVVDTTCGSVLNVWKNVERYAKAGMTALMHGKVNHEETSATISRTTLYPDGHYIVVLDMEEAEHVADYIENGGDAAAFMARFAAPKTSAGFDPDRHLQRIGVANQTTMLSGESLAIARRIGEALEARYGDADDPARFRSFDTICSATQERQDALAALVDEPLDLLIVVGGYNSSNTGHLAEMAEGKVKAWHVKGPECLVSAEQIRYKPVGQTTEAEDADWLPMEGPLRIGLTAGASTPDAVLGAVVQRVLELRGATHEGETLALPS
ncbi:MAG: 4-hydroxy-3-methylbut-2-enyl diphosphate reductase [Planctomycetota bacterium]|nr:4-hydroxy-3-methylbut-2-enyl diphosphate reductase [Planctomycetota bacterium]